MTNFPNVTLDSLQLLFRTQGGPVDVDSAGVEWLLTKFDGWAGIPAPRTARTDKPGHAGTFRSAAYRSARIITAEFIATAPDDVTMRAAEQQVAAVCSDPGRLYEMVVTESGHSRSVMVELDDAILATPRTWYSTLFSVRLAAPDPRKHDSGWQSPTAGMGTPPIGGLDFTAPGVLEAAPGMDFGTPGSPSSAAVHNAGTAPAHPVFVIVGPATRPSVVDVTNGRTVTWTGTLGPSDTLTVNSDDFPVLGYPGRSAYLNTSNYQRPALVLPSGWPTVAPGQSVTYNLQATSFTTATMTVSLRSAWY